MLPDFLLEQCENVEFPRILDNNKLLSFFFIFASLIAENGVVVSLICISLISSEIKNFSYNYWLFIFFCELPICDSVTFS